MDILKKIILWSTRFSIFISIFVIAASLVYYFIYNTPSKLQIQIDYINVTIILLTTVTIIFSVCAIILGLLGIIGFKKMIQTAEKFAEDSALNAIKLAFEEKGLAANRIEEELLKDDSALQMLIERQIKNEVYEFLPLFLSENNGDNLADGEPTDEGDIN